MCFFYGSIFDLPHNYDDIHKDLFIYLFCHSHRFFDLIFKCISGSDIVCSLVSYKYPNKMVPSGSQDFTGK